MTKKELVNRWKTSEGQQLLFSILSNLKKNKPLDKIKGLEKYAGRWDLRGAILSILKTENKIQGEGTSFTQKYGSLKLKKTVIESVDFSYADISYSWWQECQVSNCLFEDTKACELHVYATDFTNCTFRKVNFTYSDLNRNIGKKSGSFKGSYFIDCNLKECILSFPNIENCRFENCNFIATNFDGSRFKDCKFIGKVDSSWFSGYSTTAQKSIFGIFNRVNPRDYPNLMENVDFSEAELVGVSFINGIDLSECTFPHDDKRYLLIENLDRVYPNIKKIIDKEWAGEEKRKGLAFIDVVLYKPNYHNQKMDLVDKMLLTDQGKDSEFGEKFFNLLKRVNTEVQAE